LFSSIKHNTQIILKASDSKSLSFLSFSFIIETNEIN